MASNHSGDSRMIGWEGCPMREQDLQHPIRIFEHFRRSPRHRGAALFLAGPTIVFHCLNPSLGDLWTFTL